MSGLRRLILVIMAVSSFVVAGVQPAVPASSPGTPAAGVKAAPGADWERKWETTLAGARKEGIVRVYTIWAAKTRTLLSQAFKEKYGIELEFTPFARGAELLAKYQAEKRAGLQTADVFGVGASSLITMIKPAGLLGPLEPLLILPEVTDPNGWSGKKFPFIDHEKLIVGMIAAVQRHIDYNTDMIKEGEITGYKDLLKPQYKGKIAIADPRLTGTAAALFNHLTYDLWNAEEASKWLRQILVQQEAVIQREHRLVVEWVAKGKYPIGIAGQSESVAEFMNLGAPINVVIQKEGHFVDYAAGALGVPTAQPHPNAAAVFVNWLLTKEGQTLFAVKGYGYPSLRHDVSTQGINPMFIPRPNEKLFYLTEGAIKHGGRMMEVAKKIVEEANK